MGDAVNVTARLASAAGAGEVLVTASAARAARLETEGVERRTLELKGKTVATEVLVLYPGRRAVKPTPAPYSRSATPTAAAARPGDCCGSGRKSTDHSSQRR